MLIKSKVLNTSPGINHGTEILQFTFGNTINTDESILHTLLTACHR